MDKKRSEALYQRLMSSENFRVDRIASQKLRVRQKEAAECTFQPRINTKSKSKARRSKSPVIYYDKNSLQSQMMRYRGMPEHYHFELEDSEEEQFDRRADFFERTETFINERREKLLLKKKKARAEKVKKEMENCSFRPKINSDSYLKKRKIKRKSKHASRVDRSCPGTPNGNLRKPFGRRIDSQKYLELEFREEQNKSIVSVNNPNPKKSKKTKDNLTPTRRRKTKSSNTSLLQFRTPNRKSKMPQRSQTPNNASRMRFKPFRTKSRPKNIKKMKKRAKSSVKYCPEYKRSIVILNENDEFEDIDVYIAKRKSQMKIRRKNSSQIKQQRALFQQSDDDYLDMEVELKIEEEEQESQHQNVVEVSVRELSDKTSEPSSFSKLSFSENDFDKENNCDIWNVQSAFRKRRKKKERKFTGENKNRVRRDGEGFVQEEIGLYNDGVLSEKKLFERHNNKITNSNEIPASQLEAVLIESQNQQKKGRSPSRFQRGRKKKGFKHEQIKDSILMEKQTHKRNKSKSNPFVKDTDFLKTLHQRNQHLQFTFANPENSQLQFAENSKSRSRSRKPRDRKSKKLPKQRDFLIINGEKIYFNESTIQSIVNVDRVNRLSNLRNIQFGPNRIEL